MLGCLVLFCQEQTKSTGIAVKADDGLLLESASSDTIPSQRRLMPGKLTRRAKAAQKRLSARPTTAGVRIDTNFAARLAAIRALPRDSSARIAHFTYVRKDKPVVQSTYRKKHSLFLADPPIVRYQVSLDTAKWIYRLRYVIDKDDIRIPIDIPLEEYSTLRLNQSVRKNWESLTQSFKLVSDTKTTLGDLMGSITKIEVPIPKNPIFSIFGPNIIKLNVNGAIDIHAGFRNTEYDRASSSVLGQSQSTPDFKQQIQVTVDGEIGDKLKIAADWNTQRTFEYENQLHVKYQGYQDEIVQSVEAGNVSLPTNSSFISGGSALFGILSRFQLGPLRLTTVATQKKGQIKEITVSGGGEAKPFEIRPAEYSQNHFFIDESYISLYNDYYLNNGNLPTDTLIITDLEVWITSTASLPPLGARRVVAFIEQDSVLEIQDDKAARRLNYDPVPGEIEQGLFVKLTENTEYEYNTNTGVLTLKTAVQNNQAVAVYYVVRGSGSTQKRIGNSGQEVQESGDSLKLVMKLVKPANFHSGYKKAWDLQLKNRYSLGIFGIDKDNFEFFIEYQLPGKTAVKEVLPQGIGLMEIFGLDRFTGTGDQEVPDKSFDFRSNITIDEANGEIIFPTVEPFSKKSIEYFLSKRDPNLVSFADSLSYESIYDTTITAAQNDIKNRYYLRGNAKGTGASDFSIGFNTVEGSVQVISGGQRLIPGVDYVVDYISNKVIIKNQMYLAPGRDIQIKYEANDMFQLASKSLLGARGEFDLGTNSTFGFTIMNYSQQSLSDKIRVGEEPISNMMLGVDGRTEIEAPGLTDLLNYIPGIKSMVPSKISLSGEAAYMLPNPNTRTSPVKSDEGKGVAYIDDFEGARQTIPLGGSYLSWKESSAPWYSRYIDNTYTPGGIDGKTISTSGSLINNGILADSLKMHHKASLSWFNVLPSDLIIGTIWGSRRKDAVAGEDQVTSLDLYFRPNVRGAFNYSMNMDQTIGQRWAWGGIQRALSTASTDLVDQNVAFIELWINIVENLDSSAVLNIDLGYISEDVVPNRKLNTEDGLDSPSGDQRGVLNPNYDWGLDMLSNAKEQSEEEEFIDFYKVNGHPEYEQDPSGDNWARLREGGALRNFSDADKYIGVNGTEGNYSGAETMLPDGEDLNGNKSVEWTNSYFEYEIPLDTNSVEFGKLVSGSGINGWHQIRIPLSDYTRKIGDPSLTSVQSVRVWITGAEKPMLLRVVEFNLVGNQWEKRERTDSSYEVSVVNKQDNYPYYNPEDEIGIEPQRDRARDDKEVFSNEQSLSIIVKNLPDGEEKEAVRNFSIKPLDMFNYKTLKMFVHGETGFESVKGYREFKYRDTSDYDARFFIRFGDDIFNCYEYSAPVHPKWEGNEVIIKFADLTALKALDSLEVLRGILIEGGPPGAKYRMLGNPRLNSIRFISIGVQNPEGKGDPFITGELWANELRLTDVDDTPGWAYKFDAKISLADIASLSFSYMEKNPFFHQLEVPFGDRNTTRSWNISTALSLGKLLPDSWAGSVIDASYSHTESSTEALYVPGTDILVEKVAEIAADTSNRGKSKYKDADDVRLHSQDLLVTDSYSIPAIKLIIPLKTWLITETINKMSFGYNYSISHSRSPSIESLENWRWNMSFQYATQFNKNNYASPFSLFGDFFVLRPWKKFKVFFTPQSLSLAASFSRTRTSSQSREAVEPAPPAHTLSSARSMKFNWQFFENGLLDFGVDYGVSITSSLEHFETGKNGQLRSFYDILGDIFFSDRLINFGIDQSYNQTIAFNTKLEAPKVLMLNKIFTPNFRYSVGYVWSNNIASGNIGRSARWSANPALTLDINLKPLSDIIWTNAPPPRKTRRDTSSANEEQGSSFDISRILLKNTFFDFDKINISFSQQNSAANNGIRGRSGFANLFSRIPFFQSSLADHGPSLLYQLGLASDPNGRLVLKTKGTFPFITGHTYPGIRATDSTGTVNITNEYTQNNIITLQTSRPLWQGASLDLNWKVGWVYNKTTNGKVNSEGYPENLASTVSGSVTRSYICLPPFLIFKLFKTDLEKVNEKFIESKTADEENKTSDAEKLSQAFEEGLEAMPWLSKILGPLAPRVNWTFRWGGLENISFMKSFATSISLDHSYSSTHTQNWKTDIGGKGEKDITSQSVMYGFSPLLGLNIAFKDIGNGKLNTTFRYNTTTTYDLTPSSLVAVETSRSDIAISATYSQKGFELPFFGLSLMNNIDVSINYSFTNNTSLKYDFKNYISSGVSQGGTSTTTIEPRVRYSLSERVTAALYYRYSKVTPDEGGGIVPGSTTNEGGLDINIAIKP
ncbi:MAG: cell surface protein SprA [Bacteroidetes bacterium]|nr:cell surface protein SprA [Bacteroidota bacterium]